MASATTMARAPSEFACVQIHTKPNHESQVVNDSALYESERGTKMELVRPNALNMAAVLLFVVQQLHVQPPPWPG